MAGSSLFALIDDIATLLDDVSLLTKIAAKKTAGVLGDDLALNAQQVSGIRAERELPVVWAVGKGSLVNKAILVPMALLISTVTPVLVTPLLMIGGAFLCFEGCEKLAHKWLHGDSDEEEQRISALKDPNIDVLEFERDQVKGAIRTDFVLSAEIITITLGSVADQNFITQLTVMAGIGVIMTVGVYGLVAAIVKLDDLGLYLSRRQGQGVLVRFGRTIGYGLLRGAPYLMKALSVGGTIAMFMVGGGILAHGIAPLHHAIEAAQRAVAGVPAVGRMLASLMGLLLQTVSGVLVGLAVLLVVTLVQRIRKPKKH